MSPYYTVLDVDGNPVNVHTDAGRLVSISISDSKEGSFFADLTAEQASKLSKALQKAARISQSGEVS